jgi:hypothetical protein
MTSCLAGIPFKSGSHLQGSLSFPISGFAAEVEVSLTPGPQAATPFYLHKLIRRLGEYAMLRTERAGFDAYHLV